MAGLLKCVGNCTQKLGMAEAQRMIVDKNFEPSFWASVGLIFGWSRITKVVKAKQNNEQKIQGKHLCRFYYSKFVNY